MTYLTDLYNGYVKIMEEFNAKEVADNIINEMIKSGRWEQLRVDLASTLGVDNHFKATEARVQEILLTEQLKNQMRQMGTTEQDVAEMVKRAGGLQTYEAALIDALSAKSAIGSKLQKEVYKMVDERVDRSSKKYH